MPSLSHKLLSLSFSENQKALSHVHEMNAKAQCHVPIKKVIKVKDAASSPNLEFFPECTIVYRCSEESGCCGETEQCVPKSHTTITRHFYVGYPIWYSTYFSHESTERSGDSAWFFPLYRCWEYCMEPRAFLTPPLYRWWLSKTTPSAFAGLNQSFHSKSYCSTSWNLAS